MGPQTAFFESASQLWAQIQVKDYDGSDTVINACLVRLCGGSGEPEGNDDIIWLDDFESVSFCIDDFEPVSFCI